MFLHHNSQNHWGMTGRWIMFLLAASSIACLMVELLLE